MKRLVLLVVALGLLLFGCTTFKASGLAMAPSDAKYTVLGNFETDVWVNEFLGASAGAKLFNISADATDGPVGDAIARAVRQKGGTGAVNITIEHRASFLDLICEGITLSLWSPSLVKITGTVIK
jgi:hypothetical protein